MTLFRVTLGTSQEPFGGTVATRTHRCRVEAFRRVRQAAEAAAVRGCDSDTLTAAFESLVRWDRSGGGKSPRMTSEPSSREWYLEIERVS